MIVAWLSNIKTAMTLNLLITTFLFLSFLFLVMTVRRYRQKQWLRSGINATLTLSLIALSAASILIISNFYSYQRLTYEQLLADVHIKSASKQHYQLTLALPHQNPEQFEIVGDDWQIDARVLKWHHYANLLGLDLQYQFERLSGRFTDIKQETSALRSVYSLNEDSRIDIWQLARRHPAWLPFVDATYGSAAYVPLNDGAHYQVFATQSGLIIRAANDTADKAVTNWR